MISRMKNRPHLYFEEKLWKKKELVCGIDEVGRGCFAGPLVIGAVILKPTSDPKVIKKLLSLGINDSKLLSPKKRKLIYTLSKEFIDYSLVQFISVEEINAIGIGDANKKGFNDIAYNVLEFKKRDIFFLTDAFKISEIAPIQQQNIIRGDSVSVSIALASIIAKVERDSFMENLAKDHPSYGFEKHKGYGTLYHRKKLQELGPSIYHRDQFIRNYI